ncbi:SpoIIE family protein phosphatase [bacterium]|nr:SpoIIE family protein phosphatase [bacterium]
MFNFNTIKSKIIVITVALFLVTCLILAVFMQLIYLHDKQLIRRSCGYNIEIFEEKINQEIADLESNATDLALLGELYFESNNEKKAAEYMLTNIFNGYPKSLGGGIWFEPYLIDKNKKRSCIYTYRNDSGEMVIDYSFESQDYDYLNQAWYKDIKSKLRTRRSTAWSKPYFENHGSKTLMVTVGSGLYYKDMLVGISTVDWRISSVIQSISSMKPTPNSFSLFADLNNDYIIATTDPYLKSENMIGKSLSLIPWFKEYTDGISTLHYHGKKYISYADILDNGMILITNVPEIELVSHLIKHLIILMSMLIFITFILSYIFYLLLTNNIIKPIHKLTFIANKIRHGDLDAEIKVEKPEEFERLASTFNKMTKDIKNIMREQEHYLSELHIAKEIQKSSLPNVFPPFPERKDFDIYASMEAAKEVGGDFYDFYFTDDDKLMFLIADVSGKGVPAALFMMTVKNIVNNISQFENSPKEMIKKVNQTICDNNKQGFFVTMLIGIIDLKTGKLTFINCGHNPPLIRHNGVYEYHNMDTNLVLGMVDDFDYEVHELQLEPNDVIFMYTDGITEATNEKEVLYGEERLLSCLNKISHEDMSRILGDVKEEIHGFIGNMPQSDDMTMLVFRYNGADMLDCVEKFECAAKKDNYKSFNEWLTKSCREWSLDSELLMKIELSSEEIFTNIFSYGYPDNQIGKIEVTMRKDFDGIELEFTDDGIAYNPLQKEDPDINLSIEEREVGGLGIFMVKQMASEIKYDYKNGKNILTLKFRG